MSDTPQNDEVINEEVNTEVEINDSAVDSDTTTPVEGGSEQQVDEVELKRIADEKSNAAFNKNYGKLKQAERERDELKVFKANAEQAERERQAAQVGNIPPMPDQFDDDFESKVKQRDEALVAQANYNAQNQAYMQQQQLNQQQVAQAKEVELRQSMHTYSNKAVELGIKQEELQAAGNAVAGYGLSDELVIHIINDPDGPLITKHLAANPQDGYQLANMSAFSVGTFLDGIKQKASALKPKTSNTPSPATNLQGNGAGEQKHPALQGVIYT